MHSLTYNDQKNKVHAHFGMTDYTKDGYTSISSSNKGTEGAGTKSSYPSKSWDLISTSAGIGARIPCSPGLPTGKIVLTRPYMTSTIGETGTAAAKTIRQNIMVAKTRAMPCMYRINGQFPRSGRAISADATIITRNMMDMAR